MRKRHFHVIAVAVMLCLVYLPAFVMAGGRRTVPEDVTFFNEMVQNPQVSALFGENGPWFTAPLPQEPDGPSYALGGLDVCNLLDYWNDASLTDLDHILFAFPWMLGNPEFSYVHEVFPGYQTTFIFTSAENAARCGERLRAGSLQIAFGGWCAYGVSADWDKPKQHSHFAQPGHTGFTVHTYRSGKESVDVVYLNLWIRAGDYKALGSKAHKAALGFFKDILNGAITDLTLWRQGVPVFSLDDIKQFPHP